MDLTFTFEQQQLRNSVQKMLQGCASRSQGGVSGHEVHTELVDMGILQLALLEENSGVEDGMASIIAVMEELGRYRVAEPFLSTFLAARLLAPAIARGTGEIDHCLDIPGSVAIYEPGARYTFDAPLVKAQERETGYLLNGTKVAVSTGGNPDRFIVSARVSGSVQEETGLFVVNAEQTGVEIINYPTIDGGQAGSLVFDKVELKTGALLCRGDLAESLIADHVQVASLLLPAEALGLMERLLELTVEYCNQRRQFDKPIGKFQVIQHRLADLYIHCESIRSLLYAALANYSESSEDTKASIAALKFKVGELGRLAGEVSVQLHGAIGFTEEYSAGRYYKRLMVIDALYGNTDYQLQNYLSAG